MNKLLFWQGKTERIKALEAQVQHMADVVNATLGPITTQYATYRGNEYVTAEAQVTALSDKYEANAEWGCQLTRNVVDLRAAFIMGPGIKCVQVEGETVFEPAREFVDQFMEANNLSEEGAQNWAKEAEIEGKFLCRLMIDEKNEGIMARFVPWTQHGYVITADEEDYAQYELASWRVNKTGRPITLKAWEFVYGRFGGRTHKVNECPPKLGAILPQIEALDKAMRDWREINKFHASPTPVIKAETPQAGETIEKTLAAKNWKIGKLLVIAGGEFSIAGPPTGGLDSLEKEITRNATMISGGSGVPVQFLGFPELMSNRATADNLMELVYASTVKERRTWVGVFNELFRKSIGLYNERFGQNLNGNAVKAELPELSAQKMQELVEVWLPLKQEGVISLETTLSRIPDIDVQDEMAKLKREQKENQSAFERQYGAGAGQGNEGGDGASAGQPSNVAPFGAQNKAVARSG
jgi:hypothetical protein